MGKRKIELKDVGPIEALTIGIPDAGGVVVLMGKNGGGKSHALSAVAALVSGQGTVPTRDGALGAIVEGLGARLSVGRRSTRSGECEILTLEGPDPSLLVDPGIKDRGAAHAERIKALCRLAGAQLDREAFHKIVGGADEFARLVKPDSMLRGDVPSCVAAVKRDIEAAARAEGLVADNLEVEARGIASAADDVPETEPLDERALQQELEFASAQLGELRGRQTQADELRKSAARARETLESYGDKGTKESGEAAEKALEDARAAIARIQFQLEERENRVRDARETLSAAEGELAERKAAMRAAIDAERQAGGAVEQAFADFTRRKQLAQASKAADAAADVDPEQIKALEARQSNARTALQRAEVVRHAIEQRARAAAKAEESGEARARSHALRDAARGCEGILTSALSKVCPEGMSVHEGLLVVETDRGSEPFDELSHGERWKWALDIASRAIQPPGLLVCRQEGWESLQPAVQHEVDAMARARGLVILAAKADDGELRAETLEPTVNGRGTHQ